MNLIQLINPALMVAIFYFLYSSVVIGQRYNANTGSDVTNCSGRRSNH